MPKTPPPLSSPNLKTFSFPTASILSRNNYSTVSQPFTTNVHALLDKINDNSPSCKYMLKTPFVQDNDSLPRCFKFVCQQSIDQCKASLLYQFNELVRCYQLRTCRQVHCHRQVSNNFIPEYRCIQQPIKRISKPNKLSAFGANKSFYKSKLVKSEAKKPKMPTWKKVLTNPVSGRSKPHHKQKQQQ